MCAVSLIIIGAGERLVAERKGRDREEQAQFGKMLKRFRLAKASTYQITLSKSLIKLFADTRVINGIKERQKIKWSA